MIFDEARHTIFPFGKYKGKTLDRIAETDEGLRYLDWVVSHVESERLLEAVRAYLEDPSIAKDLEKLTEER